MLGQKGRRFWIRLQHMDHLRHRNRLGDFSRPQWLPFQRGVCIRKPAHEEENDCDTTETRQRQGNTRNDVGGRHVGLCILVCLNFLNELQSAYFWCGLFPLLGASIGDNVVINHFWVGT